MEIDVESIKLEPFYVQGLPVTQVSDHVGISCRFSVVR